MLLQGLVARKLKMEPYITGYGTEEQKRLASKRHIKRFTREAVR